jgi:hypothetical protein
MALTPAQTIQPPFYDQPLTDYPSGQQFSQAWTEYHQTLADRVTALPGAVQTGVVDGSDAAPGMIGEFMTASGSATLANGVAANIASLPLTAGDWDVWGYVLFTAAATTHPTEVQASVSTSSGSLSQPRTMLAATFNVGSQQEIGTGGAQRISTAAATTAFLVGFSTFTTAGMTAAGNIIARRMR